MTTITIKNIPDDVVERLKEQAARNRRSMNSEAIRCLESWVAAERVDEAGLMAELGALRERAGVYISKADVRSAKDAGRP